MGTRPLTVLSMVYRLWAMTLLWEVMRWQEARVHPRAYKFRPARGAVDAAKVTHVLPELARLKGWQLEGLSLDYVKCFDLIPQAVVLRITRGLGMDNGVLRALAAMYRHLWRAFRLAGALRAWWQATNGILKGCPLSVIRINLLTTVWKMKIDTMRRHVVVMTAALPPLLEQPRAALGQPLPSPPAGARTGARGHVPLGVCRRHPGHHARAPARSVLDPRLASSRGPHHRLASGHRKERQRREVQLMADERPVGATSHPARSADPVGSGVKAARGVGTPGPKKRHWTGAP